MGPSWKFLAYAFYARRRADALHRRPTCQDICRGQRRDVRPSGESDLRLMMKTTSDEYLPGSITQKMTACKQILAPAADRESQSPWQLTTNAHRWALG